MIIVSTLECAQTYDLPSGGRVDLTPGRNGIRDDWGRELLGLKSFQDMLATTHPAFMGKIKVVIPPAEDPAKVVPAKGKKATPAPPPDGETAVSNLPIDEAVRQVRQLEVVEQLQDIMLRDPRPDIKAAAEERIQRLAEMALAEGQKTE